ncbi:GerAB/ArcD/ProY family transporter [Virgibacillus salexigens]|uniref:Spore germination protein YndE n=1 Tax=Virgibacillus massiliensis TaxID=1462526 RepID=A0A024QGH0_9BACI|nr:GerAB/ArcD/ProY family transporter [Virgibacillus massiliensis]CDQ41300.1 Spore germination protein YndE [Virgibacillus massiliensis]
MTVRVQIGVVFIILHLSFGYLVYPNLIYALTEVAHWRVVLLQGLFQISLIWIYIKGLNYFPKNDLVDIFLKIGKWAGFILLIPFVINIIFLVAFNTRLHTDVINEIFLSRTPNWAILFLIFSISVYTAIKGIGTILRSSILIFIIVVPLVLFNIFSSGINADVYNALPAWDLSVDFLIDKKFVYILAFSSFLFLGLMTSEIKLRFGPIFLSWLIILLFLLSVVYIPLFIFGQETVARLEIPFLEAMESVEIRWFPFSRQTMFLGISLVGLVILANAVMLWLIGRIIHKMAHWKLVKPSYWIIAFSITSLIIALSITSTSWDQYIPWIAGIQLYSMIVIPLTIFIYGSFQRGGNRE